MVVVDPGEDLVTPAGTGRLGRPDGDGGTWSRSWDRPAAWAASGWHGGQRHDGRPDGDVAGRHRLPLTCHKLSRVPASARDSLPPQGLPGRQGPAGPGRGLSAGRGRACEPNPTPRKENARCQPRHPR
jgi:hypothetical protein